MGLSSKLEETLVVSKRNVVFMGLWPWLAKIAIGLSRKFGNKIAWEDLAQIGTLRVLQVWDTFDESRGFKPITYFGTVAWRAMAAALLGEDKPLMSLDCDGPNGEPSLSKTLAWPESRKPSWTREQLEAVRSAAGRVTGRLGCVLRLRLGGETLAGAAMVLGLTRERIRQLEAEAFREVKRLVEGRPLPNRKKRAWKEWEKEWLRANQSRKSVEDLAEFLGRSVDSVIWQVKIIRNKGTKIGKKAEPSSS